MDTKRICPICGKSLAPGAPEGLCPECLLKAGLGTGVEIGPDTADKAPRFTPPKIDELAAKFAQLDILEFVGRGGMGAVYKARQKQLDRVVALKILPPQAGGAAFAERFTREARALARLNHPHIVTLYEFGQSDGLFYFLMEFVDGVNLRQLLSNSRISPHEALAIVPQICEALQFAHDSGIVHRDIKPENILIEKRGLVKIADFGVAKMIAESLTEPFEKAAPAPGELTKAGSTLGTPQYMAPEQIRNSAEVDHRADIYSLGVVFYQMLTGELPSGKIEPPSRRVRIDVRLDEVVLRALEKRPELRFQQADEVKTAVETIAGTPSPVMTSMPEAPTSQQNAQQITNTTRTVRILRTLFIIALAYQTLDNFLPYNRPLGQTLQDWLHTGGSERLVSWFELDLLHFRLGQFGWGFCNILGWIVAPIALFSLAIFRPRRWVFITGPAVILVLTANNTPQPDMEAHSLWIPMVLDFSTRALSLVGFAVRWPKPNMKQCLECGQVISVHATVCPKCGTPSLVMAVEEAAAAAAPVASTSRQSAQYTTNTTRTVRVLRILLIIAFAYQTLDFFLPYHRSQGRHSPTGCIQAEANVC